MEALVDDVAGIGVILEVIFVAGGVAGVSPEVVDRNVFAVGVILEAVGAADAVGAVVGEVFVGVGGEVDVGGVFLEGGLEEGRRAEEIRRCAEFRQARGQRVAGGELGEGGGVDRGQRRGLVEEEVGLWEAVADLFVPITDQKCLRCEWAFIRDRNNDITNDEENNTYLCEQKEIMLVIMGEINENKGEISEINLWE